MSPPSKADVIAACREPRWPTAAEIAEDMAFHRQWNATVLGRDDSQKKQRGGKSSKTGFFAKLTR